MLLRARIGVIELGLILLTEFESTFTEIEPPSGDPRLEGGYFRSFNIAKT